VQSVNDLLSNPGVAVLLGVVVSTFGTALGSYINSRLEVRRMDREDRRQRAQWERDEKERKRQELSTQRQERLSLYNDFVSATNVHPSSTDDLEGKLNKLYFQVAMTAPTPVTEAARDLRRAALSVIDMSDQERYVEEGEEQRRHQSLEDQREAFLAAVRDT
jgi:hypothetical protein